MDAHNFVVSDMYYMDPTEHEFKITVGELRLLYYDWIDRLIDSLEDRTAYESLGKQIIAHAQERLECIADILGKCEVYDTLMDEIRKRSLSEKELDAFFEDFGNFGSLNPEWDRGEEPVQS